ncbi:MAG: hypothetical protein AUK49_10775 [Betaproteobacteria bacterium CG2_30_68_42]|nr:MAG: hypothetical protein AUK49_10775 [Betaproteobacteria bacterium CG2_30_68_42]PJA57660.1 MAG: hypothetical protein CO164_06620 [Rhodocyclales bacterium CG_4_9_14_3_um_filter_68_10]
MDQQIVYLRTPTGEQAIAQKTRIVQRNLRNVLDLVDGRRSVGEILRKFGDATIAEAALADLERGGFVETARARALREGAGQADAGAPEATADKIERLKKETFAALDGDENITIMDPLDFPEAGIAGTASGGEAWGPGAAAEDGDEFADLAAAARQQPSGKPVFTEDETALRDLHAERSHGTGRWLKRLSFALGAIVFAAAAGVIFFPFDYYLPRIELGVRASIGEPIRLGAMHFTLTPSPGIEIEHVRVGEDSALRVGKIIVAPEFGSLLSSPKILREVVLDHVEADAAVLPRIAGWFNGGYFRARSLRFDRTTLKLGRTAVEGLGGQVILDTEGRMQEIHFVDSTGTLSGTLVPEGASHRIALGAAEWKLPGYDWIKLSTFDAAGILTPGSLKIEKFDARAFDGVVSGSARLVWGDGAEFSASLNLKHVGLASLMPAVRKDLLLAGDLDAGLRMAGRASNFDKLGERLAAEGDFTIQRGVLSNFDFAEAVRSRAPGPTRGGQTRFEKAGGVFRIDGGIWRIANLSFESGLMRGAGSLTIGAAEVSGAMSVAFLGANQARAVVGVSGRIPDPFLTVRR